MPQRDALLVLAAVILAVGVAAVLLVGAVGTPAREARPRFFVGRQPPPPERSIEQLERAVPPEVRAFVPLQRQVAATAGDAAGYLLVLLGVSASLVLAREGVLASYRASLGGWRTQLRLAGTGAAIVALVASASFLAFVVLVGAAATVAGPRGPFGGPQPFLQGGLVALTVGLVFVGLIALVGFAAASWRLGDALLSLRPLARWSSAVPRPLVALIGASLIYLAAQLPTVGAAIAFGAIAYALGAVITARLTSVDRE